MYLYPTPPICGSVSETVEAFAEDNATFAATSGSRSLLVFILSDLISFDLQPWGFGHVVGHAKAGRVSGWTGLSRFHGNE